MTGRRGIVGSPPGPRPHLWQSGQDPQRHEQYVAWGRARAQAHYRGEEWLLTREEYYELWGDLWCQRGRAWDSLCMTRRDPDAAWSTDNCEIVPRHEHARRAQNRRII